MFSVNVVNKCQCGNICSYSCILKCCINCCGAKICPKHTKSNTVSQNICYLCGEIMNNYLLLKTDTIVNYCECCYKKFKEKINYLILTFAEKEQYDKFNIKYNSLKNAKDRYNDDTIIRNKLKEIESKK